MRNMIYQMIFILMVFTAFGIMIMFIKRRQKDKEAEYQCVSSSFSSAIRAETYCKDINYTIAASVIFLGLAGYLITSFSDFFKLLNAPYLSSSDEERLLRIVILIGVVFVAWFVIFMQLCKAKRESKLIKLGLTESGVTGRCEICECTIPYEKIKRIHIIPEQNVVLKLLGFSKHTITVSTGKNEYIFPYIKGAQKIVFEINKRIGQNEKNET